MQEQQPVNQPFSRPMARPLSGNPMQRTNYGIPQRQVRPMAPNPLPQAQVNDVMPVVPAAQPQPPVTAAAVQPAMQVAPATASPAVATPSPALAPVSSQKPLFTAAPVTEPAKPLKRSLFHRHLPKIQVAVLVLAAILLVGGVGRWLTTDDISSYKSAVGAVYANDGSVMKIQFVADDGQMHRFNAKSKDSYIPGSAVEIAYRSGAPDKTVVQVANVKKSHNLGVGLIVASIASFGLAGLLMLVHRSRLARERAHMPVPVSV